MAKKHKLNVKQIEALMKQPGVHCVGEGLYLQVHNADSRSWVCRYQIANDRRSMGLGSCDLVTIAEAFAASYEARRLAKAGTDPIAARKAQQAEQRLKEAKSITFKAAAEQYVDLQTPGWTNPRVPDIWRSSLELYAYPTFGKLPVQAIDAAQVLKALGPIWLTKTPTAKRVRQRIEAIFEWATAHGYRTGDNPARQGPLMILLPKQNHVVEHMAALPYAEIAAFMRALKEQTGTDARALAFAILTTLRTTSVIGAQWSEIDFAKRVWTVPPERMKTRKEHRVPLAPAALDVLREMEKAKEGPHVFPAMRGPKSKPISERALREVLKAMGRTDLDPHGFRSTFRDWASETTDHDANVCEMALAHSIKSEVEKSYRRGDLFEKRRALMSDWADYCAGRPAQGEKVVPLRATRTGAD